MNDLDIKKIRVELGLNQEEFANLIGFSKSAVQKWESGERNPDDKTTHLIKKTTQKHTFNSINNSNINSDGGRVKVDSANDISNCIEEKKELLERLKQSQDQLAESQKQVSKLIDIISKK